jgi:hypothetical protein
MRWASAAQRLRGRSLVACSRLLSSGFEPLEGDAFRSDVHSMIDKYASTLPRLLIRPARAFAKSFVHDNVKVKTHPSILVFMLWLLCCCAVFGA